MLLATLNAIFLARLELYRHVRHLRAEGQMEASEELGKSTHQLGQQVLEAERGVRKHRLESHCTGPLRTADEKVH